MGDVCEILLNILNYNVTAPLQLLYVGMGATYF